MNVRIHQINCSFKAYTTRPYFGSLRTFIKNYTIFIILKIKDENSNLQMYYD